MSDPSTTPHAFVGSTADPCVRCNQVSEHAIHHPGNQPHPFSPEPPQPGLRLCCTICGEVRDQHLRDRVPGQQQEVDLLGALTGYTFDDFMADLRGMLEKCGPSLAQELEETKHQLDRALECEKQAGERFVRVKDERDALAQRVEHEVKWHEGESRRAEDAEKKLEELRVRVERVVGRLDRQVERLRKDLDTAGPSPKGLAIVFASLADSLRDRYPPVTPPEEAHRIAMANMGQKVEYFGDVKRDGDRTTATVRTEDGEEQQVEIKSLCECGAGPERLSVWHGSPPGWDCRECGGFVPRSHITGEHDPNRPTVRAIDHGRQQALEYARKRNKQLEKEA